MDDVESWVLGVALGLAGVLLVWLGRKQARGTLRRNRIVGLRTWETLRSDEAWFAAHTKTAGLVTAAGVVQLAAAAALLLARVAEDAVTVIVLTAAGVTMVLVLVAGVRAHRVAARVNRE